MFSFLKKKKIVSHIKLNGVIGNAGKFKQGIDFAGQEEIIKKERTKEDFNNIISLINKYKIINECYQKAQHYINLASNSLSVFQDTKEKEILKNLTSFSLARNF